MASQPYRLDSHIHTVYSGHGEGTVAEVVAAAGSRGLSNIAFTEHLTMPEGEDPQNAYSMSAETVRHYSDDVLEQRGLHPEMGVVLGTEADWIGDEDFLIATVEGFDYILGSVHFVDGWAFDNPANREAWAEHDVNDVWRRYVEIWCEAARSSVPFDCMSHPDLPKKFGNLPTADPRELYYEMADAASEMGRAVEVNTSGMRHTIGEPYPCLPLLKAFHDRGVRCTVGSDAHSPHDVFSGIPVAVQLMGEAGYDQVMVPGYEHSYRFVPLEEMS